MPTGVASVEVAGSKAALVLSPNGTGEPDRGSLRPGVRPGGSRADHAGTQVGALRPYVPAQDQQEARLPQRQAGRHWALNGNLYPRAPMFEVAKGDLVRIDLINDSSKVHPMHLHGHHFLVLTRNGKAVSPWSTDTLNMLPHERYEVAFRANNPGLWMLHCHNLPHAADGLTMHVMYDGVTTPSGPATRPTTIPSS